MNIRQCPDCKGRGRLRRDRQERTLVHYHPQPVGSTDTSRTGITFEQLPEWRECGLCGGTGRVNCGRVEEKP